MKLPRFQITLRRIFLATFWMAVCCGGVIANRTIAPSWDFRGPEMLRHVQKYATFYIALASPFIAVGTLFGRAKTGAMIGVIATSALLAVVSMLAVFDPGLPAQERNGWIATGAFHAFAVIVGLGVLSRPLIKSWNEPKP
jgi:hypothetical protein